MLSTIKNKFISFLQLILVSVYIIFEEIIWEGIARPVYNFVHSLQVLQKIETSLHSINAYVILVIFIVLLSIVQTLGIYAGILFVSGQVIMGISFYLSKIPIAAFTFWMFRVTEDKLMQFGWFKWLYMKIMDVITWIKSREMYERAMESFKRIKEHMKKYIQTFKAKYFSNESPFMTKVKNLYQTIKASLKK